MATVHRLAAQDSRVHDTIHIGFLDATIGQGGRTTPLAGREFDLACGIALRARPVSRATLIEEIWPDVEDDADAINTFNLCLHRLRKRLGRRDAVCLTPHGYALGDNVISDLRALEIFVERLTGQTSVSSYEADLAAAAHRRLIAFAIPARESDIGARFARTIESLRARFARALATLSLHRNERATALAMAREMIVADECDEVAWEIAIRAHLAGNDRDAALDEYRIYARTVAHELGLAPSRTIAALIAQSAPLVASPYV